MKQYFLPAALVVCMVQTFPLHAASPAPRPNIVKDLATKWRQWAGDVTSNR